jgi:hypothetical protein
VVNDGGLLIGQLEITEVGRLAGTSFEKWRILARISHEDPSHKMPWKRSVQLTFNCRLHGQVVLSYHGDQRERMFVGHFAIGFGAKRWAPKTSVGTLMFAALLADLLLFLFVAVGIEHISIRPGITRVNARRSASTEGP